jgi:hypothetical protein
MDLREIGCGRMDWIGLAQERHQCKGACEYGNEPWSSITCWEFLECNERNYFFLSWFISDFNLFNELFNVIRDEVIQRF